MAKNEQLSFTIHSHGGARDRAGRPKVLKSELPHSGREKINSRIPMHITLKLCEGISGLREPKVLAAWIRGVKRAQEKGLRIQHFSIQQNHIHLIAECDNNECLRKGMISLSGSLVWALRRIFRHYGRVFVSRYHVSTIRIPRIMRNAIKYVLFNHAHHSPWISGGDEYSSVFSLKERYALVGDIPLGDRPKWQRWIDACLSPAESWMQRVGWLRSK